MILTRGSSKEEPQKYGKMGLGCGKVAGGGMSAGMGCVRVFNTGDDRGEKLLEATVPQQVWTNHSSPREDRSDRKKEDYASCPKYSLVEVHRPFSIFCISIPQNSLFCDIQCNKKKSHGLWTVCRYSENEQDL